MPGRYVIILNGPPSCGKDSAANILCKLSPTNFVKIKVADPLKNAVHGLFGLDNIAPDFYDAVKDKPHPDFAYNIPRQCYIDMAEYFTKPRYGHKHFGEIWVRRFIKTTIYNGLLFGVISDCGFPEELQPIINCVGQEQALLIRIHGRGTYDNDSRNYVYGVCEHELDVNISEGDLNGVANAVINHMKHLQWWPIKNISI